MATYQAIAAVSASIRALLAGAAIPEIAGAEFQVVNADSLQSPMADGVAVFLYRVAVNPAARNAIDLHYLVSGYSADPIRQQLLLGWAIHVLDGTPVLTASMLNQHGPGAFQPEENVQLTPEVLTIQDEASVWNAVRALEQPSAPYVAHGVRIG
jgi:Pvc16 N-terminal domain